MNNKHITPIEFLYRLLQENQVDEIGSSDFIAPYAREIKTTFEKSRDLLYDAFDAKEIELTSRYRLRLLVLPKTAETREQQLDRKVTELTQSLQYGNYVIASNKLYDAIKKRIPLARKIVLKKFGLHDESSKKYFRHEKADIQGFLRHQKSWMSDLDKISKHRMVQYKGFDAIVWNESETEKFTIDIRLLIMSEGEFTREVRKACEDAKRFNKVILLDNIKKEINIAEARLSFLNKIKKDSEREFIDIKETNISKDYTWRK